MRSAVFIGVVLAVVACSQPLITRERAIALATEQVPASALFLRADLIEGGRFVPPSPHPEHSKHAPVWSVQFQELFANPCPWIPSGDRSHCPPDGLAVTYVVIDAVNGAVLQVLGPIT